MSQVESLRGVVAIPSLGEGWIPVADRLPTKKEMMCVATRHGWVELYVIAPVLVTDGVFIAEGIYNSIGEEYSSGLTVTHWKPMP